MSKIYIEEKEVVKYEQAGTRKSPMGEPILRVEFKDGSTLFMTSMRFQTIKTDGKSDATTARNKLLTVVAQKFYSISIEYGLRVSEMDALINVYVKTVNDSQSQANCILWGIDSEQQRDLMHVQEVLSEKYGAEVQAKKDNPDGPTA